MSDLRKLADLLATFERCDRDRQPITPSMWDALRSLARKTADDLATVTRERDEARAHLRRVLDYERAAAAHRGLFGCTCMAQSRAAEKAYNQGRCPHQLADAALAGGKS